MGNKNLKVESEKSKIEVKIQQLEIKVEIKDFENGS